MHIFQTLVTILLEVMLQIGKNIITKVPLLIDRDSCLMFRVAPNYNDQCPDYYFAC